MRKFKGTKGNWDFTDESSDRICIGTKIDVWSFSVGESEMKANAKLIAAAPMLLEALQNLLSVDEIDGISPIEAEQAAQEAINKALN